MTKLQVGDRVWLNKVDGVCTRGWYEIRSGTVEHCDKKAVGAWAGFQGLKFWCDYRIRKKRPLFLNIHCMVEQCIADGSWPE